MDKCKGRKKQSYDIVIAIILCLFLYGELQATQENKIEHSLSTEKIAPQERSHTLRLTGIVNVKNNISVFSEAAGNIKAIPVKVGDFVKKGQILSSIDIQMKKERIAQAQALLEQRELEYKAAKSLHKTGYNSDVVLSSALTALKVAELELERANLASKHAEIRSPFAGIINQVNVRRGMVIIPNTAIVNIIECNNYFATVQIPEKFVNKVHDNPAEIKLPIMQRMIKGKVDAVSMEARHHSYEIEINMPELNGQCLNIVGMNADINIMLDKVPSYHIPPYALSLSDSGIMGVKTINEQKIVEFHPVEILEEDVNGYFWIKTGVEGELNLIAHGHSYLQVGQQLAG